MKIPEHRAFVIVIKMTRFYSLDQQLELMETAMKGSFMDASCAPVWVQNILPEGKSGDPFERNLHVFSVTAPISGMLQVAKNEPPGTRYQECICAKFPQQMTCQSSEG